MSRRRQACGFVLVYRTIRQLEQRTIPHCESITATALAPNGLGWSSYSAASAKRRIMVTETTPQVTPNTQVTPQGTGTAQAADAGSGTDKTTSPTGRRPAFRDLRRQLSEEDLRSPGIQKILLDDLERAEETCEILNAYVERFHDADKRAAVFEEKLRPQNAIEIMFAVGLALGGAIVGLAPVFWDIANLRGQIALGIGVCLIIGAIIGRINR